MLRPRVKARAFTASDARAACASAWTRTWLKSAPKRGSKNARAVASSPSPPPAIVAASTAAATGATRVFPGFRCSRFSSTSHVAHFRRIIGSCVCITFAATRSASCSYGSSGWLTVIRRCSPTGRRWSRSRRSALAAAQAAHGRPFAHRCKTAPSVRFPAARWSLMIGPTCAASGRTGAGTGGEAASGAEVVLACTVPCPDQWPVPPEIGFTAELTDLVVFPLGRPHQLRHTDDAAVRGGEKRRVEDDVLDVAPRERQVRRQKIEIHVARAGCARRKQLTPDLPALPDIGERELDDELQPPQKRLVHVPFQVRRQDSDALVGLDALQQVTDLDVGVAIVRVFHLGPLSEQCVRLVEQQHRATPLGFAKDPSQVLLGLPDVLADD